MEQRSRRGFASREARRQDTLGGRVAFKPPQQQRSRESLARILDAAEQLIREQGFESMTIADVVKRSGSSVGSLYARFRNKHGLLQAVHTRYHTRVEDALAAAMLGCDGEQDLSTRVDSIVRVLCDHVLNEPELFRAFVLEAVFDPRLRAQGEMTSGRRRDFVVDALMTHRDEIKHPDPDLAARWFYTVCMAILRERITFGEAAVSVSYTHLTLPTNREV